MTTPQQSALDRHEKDKDAYHGSIFPALIQKWEPNYPTPEGVSEQTQKIVYALLDNQERNIENSNYNGRLSEVLGPDYKKKILKGIANAAFKSDIWDVIPSQPMTQPVGLVFYMKRTPEIPFPVPENVTVTTDQTISIDSIAVAAVPRRCRDGAIKQGSEQLLIDRAFAQVFSELKQGFLGDFLIAAGNKVEIEELDPYEVIKTSALIRNPANRILCHPKHQDTLNLMSDRFIVHTDYQLPEDKLIMWCSGASILDQPYFYMPYVFGFESITDPNGKMQKMLKITHRHGKRLVNQNAIIEVTIASLSKSVKA